MADDKNVMLRQLTQQFAQTGSRKPFIYAQHAGVASITPQQALAVAQKGLVGDRTYHTTSRNPLGSNRQITLIQAEHIAVISALISKPVSAALLRRNLVVSNINLLAAKSLFKDQPM